MAKEKKSFILYCDLIHTVKHLTDEQAGKVFKHLLSYVNDENPTTDDVIVNLAFEPIKRQLKRDLVKFEDKKKMRSEAGKAGALARWQTHNKNGKRIKGMAKMAVTVNDTVNDTVISNNISIDFDKLIDFYNKIYGRKIRTIPDKAKKQIKDRLKDGYTKEDFVNALQNAHKDAYHIENNYKYITLEFISRPDKFERYSQNHNYSSPKKMI